MCHFLSIKVNLYYYEKCKKTDHVNVYLDETFINTQKAITEINVLYTFFDSPFTWSDVASD